MILGIQIRFDLMISMMDKAGETVLVERKVKNEKLPVGSKNKNDAL